MKFDDIQIEKQNERPISIKNIHNNKIVKIVISNKDSFRKKGCKYFIGSKDAKRIIPLCIFLSKMSAYRREFDETKYISFLIKDYEL